MSDSFEMRPIARIRSDFGSKFGVPRQSGLVDALEAAVVFEEPYRNPDALRGLEGFSHIWLIWAFHQSQRPEWSPTVRPPPAGRQSAGGSLCQPLPLPAQSHRPLLCAAGPHRVHGRLGPGAPCPWRRPGRRHPHPGHQALPPLRGLATRRPPAALPASRRVPRWRWKSHPPCWTNCLRTGGRPCGMCWPWIPVPGISRTRTGCTASSSPGRR